MGGSSSGFVFFTVCGYERVVMHLLRGSESVCTNLSKDDGKQRKLLHKTALYK